MSEVAGLPRENENLRSRLADAEAALQALSSGEVDAVAAEVGATPTLLRAAQDTLRDSQHLLRSVFDASMDALLLADHRGQYVDANPAACKLFGLTREKLIGRTLVEFAAPGYDAEAADREFVTRGRMEEDSSRWCARTERVACSTTASSPTSRPASTCPLCGTSPHASGRRRRSVKATHGSKRPRPLRM